VFRVRKIDRRPLNGINHHVVDASFLANRCIPERNVPAGKHLDRMRACNAWWQEIEAQLESQRARVYSPDVCIAETFRVLAKEVLRRRMVSQFGSTLETHATDCAEWSACPQASCGRQTGHIKYHDISSTRDIIISVDRLCDLFHSHSKVVSIPDLIIVATASISSISTMHRRLSYISSLLTGPGMRAPSTSMDFQTPTTPHSPRMLPRECSARHFLPNLRLKLTGCGGRLKGNGLS
jgi:hypothetical protein